MTPKTIYELYAVMSFDTPVVVALCLLGLGSPRIARRGAIGLVALAGFGLAIFYLDGFPDAPETGFVLGVQAAVVLGSLLVFRSLGYRLVWRNRKIA